MDEVNGFKFLTPVAGFEMLEATIRGRLYILRELDGAQMEELDALSANASEVHLGLATVGSMLSDREGKRLYPSVTEAAEDMRRLPRGVLEELGAASQRLNGGGDEKNLPSADVSS